MKYYSVFIAIGINKGGDWFDVGYLKETFIFVERINGRGETRTRKSEWNARFDILR